MDDKTLYETALEMLRDEPYQNFGMHKDLKAVCVSEDDDLCEFVFFIEKDWLSQYVWKQYEVDDLDYWLQNEYTSDESKQILLDGIYSRTVVFVCK